MKNIFLFAIIISIGYSFPVFYHRQNIHHITSLNRTIIDSYTPGDIYYCLANDPWILSNTQTSLKFQKELNPLLTKNLTNLTYSHIESHSKVVSWLDSVFKIVDKYLSYFTNENQEIVIQAEKILKKLERQKDESWLQKFLNFMDMGSSFLIDSPLASIGWLKSQIS